MMKKSKMVGSVGLALTILFNVTIFCNASDGIGVFLKLC